MLGDEGGIMERLREIGENIGMECAKSVSLFSPFFQWLKLPYNTIFLNLTELELERRHLRCVLFLSDGRSFRDEFLVWAGQTGREN